MAGVSLLPKTDLQVRQLSKNWTKFIIYVIFR